MGRSVVSVIVPVFNEEKHIGECLDSVVKQTLKPEEIIVVDDGSTDDSARIVSSYKVKIIRQEHAGPAAARNLGAKTARGKVLVFLDADMIYDKDFIKFLTAPIVKKQAGATFTRSEHVINIDNNWARAWNEATVGQGKTRLRKDIGTKGITFRAITKEWFDRVRGFTDKGYTDDASVLLKLNKNSIAADKAICYHYNPQTLKEVFASARWMGRDTSNKGKWGMLIVFLPIWSLIRSKPLKMIFDIGYLIGLIDINVWGVHYK